jgi:hypothetical protein
MGLQIKVGFYSANFVSFSVIKMLNVASNNTSFADNKPFIRLKK